MGRPRLNIAIALVAQLALLALAPLAAGSAELPSRAPTAGAEPAQGEFAPGELVVRFDGGRERLVELPDGVSVNEAARALSANDEVAYAVPNYIARAAAVSSGWVPNDPGLGTTPGGWQELQWGFLPCGSACEPLDASGKPPAPLPFESRGGIDAEGAWKTLRTLGHPGGAGVKIAILDTGIAFRNMRPKYARSPDFVPKQFLPGFDFVSHDKVALDEDGHGTHVAGTIAEQVNNGKALAGLAYGAKVIPVRVLDQNGEGRARQIGQGIRYAVKQGARIINLSFEFGGAVQTCKQIKSVCTAIHYAMEKRVAVFGAVGNGGLAQVAFPARAPGVTGVGATTEGGCVANYSDRGVGVDIAAPGGRGEGGTPCQTADRPIFQMTLVGVDFQSFGIPSDYMGTSMSTAHVSGVAAMVLASGVLGQKPTPARLECQLRATARTTNLGQPFDPAAFGAGLLDAARAVAAPAC